MRLKAWYFPTHNGDCRLVPHEDDPYNKCLLTIKRPTPDERRMLLLLEKEFQTRGWLTEADRKALTAPVSWWRTGNVVIQAPIEKVGPVVASIVKGGRNVLTVVRSRKGWIEVCETSASLLDMKLLKSQSEESTPETTKTEADEPKAAEPQKDTPAEEKKADKPDEAVAASVRRPTPSCPDCYVDAVEPATEVLLAFLDEDQHRTWASSRYVVVRGQLTGHRYLIAHRNSPIAAQNRRIAYDLDDDATMHFHDWSVPPEEEVLSAMLVLGHREPWLRNEATCLGAHFRDVFKNPFGNGMDGIPDSQLTQRIGHALLQHLVPQRKRPRVGTASAYGWGNSSAPVLVQNYYQPSPPTIVTTSY
jgi:hypothetical protein